MRWWWLWIAGCGAEPVCVLPEPGAPEQPNLLVVLIDDVGLEQLGPWGIASDPVPTPTIDCLCREGLRFDNVWASPFCTPARVALWSGMHPRREGIGRFINVGQSSWELPLERTTLAEALRPAGYSSAFLGKWHIGAFAAPSGRMHPNLPGFTYFSGILGNVDHLSELGPKGDYFDWEHLVNGVRLWRRGYLTSAMVDDALEVIDELPEPWVVALSLQGAHSPLHTPPRRLLSRGPGADPSELEQFRAMVEAVDTELGRLLADMEPGVLSRTQIWTLSDNGTPSHGIADPELVSRGKGTLFEAGVRVPMVVTGAGVQAVGGSTDALVSILDVFPTLLQLAGAPEAPSDGASLLPLLTDPALDHHDVLYADVTSLSGEVFRAVRGPDTKLVRRGEQAQLYEVGDGLREVAIDGEDPALSEALDAFIEAYGQ